MLNWPRWEVAVSIANLAKQYPWPDTPPAVPLSDHGWFQRGSRDYLRDAIAGQRKVIVELGSWVGQSTRWLAEHTDASSYVIAIDTWRGSEEHPVIATPGSPNYDPEVARLLPILHETFLANLWHHRNRVIPIQNTTVVGMVEVKAAGVCPDVLFVDADHSTAGVLDDLYTGFTLFDDFKRTVVVGDDWLWSSVRQAVEQFAAAQGFKVESTDNAWRLVCF